MRDVKRDLYAERGVSSDKNEVHEAIKGLTPGIFPTAFCKIVEDHANNKKYCTIHHADGAGTKSSLAYAYWKETGDLSVWKGIAIDALVMNLDDLLCVGVTNEKLFYTMTIGRNKNLITSDVIKALIEGTAEFIERLRPYGINIHFAGGETADVADLVRTIIVDGTLDMRMKRKDVIIPEIAQGDCIVSLSSIGQSVYETEQNSGIGSNGLTSARHDVFSPAVAAKYPESYDTDNKSGKMYIGRFGLTDDIFPGGMTAGKYILSPTRTYAPLIVDILQRVRRQDIHAIIHCSGGGQTKVLRFLPDDVQVRKVITDIPDLFTLIQKESGEPWENMLKTFNCGYRMDIYCSTADVAAEIIQAARGYSIYAECTGSVHVRQDGEKPLVITTPHGVFEYSL